MLLRGILSRARVDVSTIRWVQIFDDAEAADLYRRGFADYYLAGPPISDILTSQGDAYAAAHLSDVGHVPWSVFQSRPDMLERSDQVLGRFTKAIQRALDWAVSRDPAKSPDVIERHFPSHEPGAVIESVRACQARGVWERDAHVSRDGLARWQPMLVESGLIDHVWAYDDIVDDRAADWADFKQGT
jgi:NitT/TauT family transport system substrate-binding protein